MPDLVARPLSAQALSDLIDRKPHLLRPLANQLLPRAFVDPAERVGIDLSSLRTLEDCRRMLAAILADIARGRIAPAEGARIAKQVGARLRAVSPPNRPPLGDGRPRVTTSRWVTQPGSDGVPTR